jgi:YD repeat-containing protein
MQSTKRTLLILAAVLLMVGSVTALAQESSIAQGQLVKVDANAKTIAIRTPQGTQMQFSYTDDTKVTGADESVAGLATMAGADLTVHYTKKQQDNVATQIEVRKKQ